MSRTTPYSDHKDQQIVPGSETSGEPVFKIVYHYMYHDCDGTIKSQRSDAEYVGHLPTDVALMDWLFHLVIPGMPGLNRVVFTCAEIMSCRYAKDDSMISAAYYSENVYEFVDGNARPMCLHIDINDIYRKEIWDDQS